MIDRIIYTKHLLYSQFAFIFVECISGYASELHDFRIAEISIEIFRVFLDNGFGSYALFCCQLGALLLTDLFAVHLGGNDALSGSLVEIINFLFGLRKRQPYLLCGKKHKV